MRTLLAVMMASACAVRAADSIPPAGVQGRFTMLSCTDREAPPLGSVDVLYGPRETVDGREYVWWQLNARKEGVDAPAFQVRALTSRDPLSASAEPIRFARYAISIPETHETLEYRDLHTKRALLPAWKDFERHFIPRRAKGAREQDGVPQTCEYLGHVLMLWGVGKDVPWGEWKDAKVLDLDRELLVGTSRSFKDTQGGRLAPTTQAKDYTYAPLTAEDYRAMIDAGMNLFRVEPKHEAWVRGEPVFYLRGVGGEPALRYPADLYRGNYVGVTMYLDEPTSRLVGDKRIHDTLRYFSDVAALLEKRVRAQYTSRGNYGAYALEEGLRRGGVNLGDLRLMQWDYPSWETSYETTYYQMAGGAAGFVHEGRYKLAPFRKSLARFTNTPREYTVTEMLQYHYAFLRGGTRAFGKDWGMAIYGQSNPQFSPEAVTLAYDMGARYVWFWTSDKDHHVPWVEQLALARTLREHARAHPRPSIHGPRPTIDKLILVPYGYFLSPEYLWWVRSLDPQGQNEASQRYKRLMGRALTAVHAAMERGESFDISVDDGGTVEGYREVVRLSDE